MVPYNTVLQIIYVFIELVFQQLRMFMVEIFIRVKYCNKGQWKKYWNVSRAHASKFQHIKWFYNAKSPQQQQHCKGNRWKKTSTVCRYCAYGRLLAMSILPHYSCCKHLKYGIIGFIDFNYLILLGFSDSLTLYSSEVFIEKVGIRVLNCSHFLAIHNFVNSRNIKNDFGYLKMISVTTHN